MSEGFSGRTGIRYKPMSRLYANSAIFRLYESSLDGRASDPDRRSVSPVIHGRFRHAHSRIVRSTVAGARISLSVREPYMDVSLAQAFFGIDAREQPADTAPTESPPEIQQV